MSGFYKSQYTTAYIRLCDVKGDFNNHSIEELIINDRSYDWTGLLHDIDKNGLQELVEIIKGDGDYNVVDGNHRLKILQYLYPAYNTLKFKIKRYEANR
tara:strand:+ start:87 stop:383 length:297 start_codon:yes stop_codon:yes gene_type:complete